MHDHLPLRPSLSKRQGRGRPDPPNPPNPHDPPPNPHDPPPNPHDPQIPPPPPPPNSPPPTVTQANPSNPDVVASYSSQFLSQSNLDSNPTPTGSYLNPNSGGTPSQVTTAFAVVSSTSTSMSHSSSSTAQKSDSGTAYSSPTSASTGPASKVGVNIAIITGVILAIVFIVIGFRVMRVVLRRPDRRTSSNRFVHDYPFAPQAQFQRIRTQSSVGSSETDMSTTSSPCVTISSVQTGS